MRGGELSSPRVETIIPFSTGSNPVLTTKKLKSYEKIRKVFTMCGDTFYSDNRYAMGYWTSMGGSQ